MVQLQPLAWRILQQQQVCLQRQVRLRWQVSVSTYIMVLLALLTTSRCALLRPLCTTDNGATLIVPSVALHVSLRSPYNTCNAGKYMYNFNSCTNCPAGQSTNGETGCTGRGGAACFGCVAGKFAASPSVILSECATCAAGTYSGEGASKCVTCQCDLVRGCSPSTGRCGNCPAGHYSGTKASTCATCAAGTYSHEGASKCITCPTKSTFYPEYVPALCG